MFCILRVTFNSPSSNMRALDSFRMATTLPRAMPSSPLHSSARRPLDATSAWFPRSAAHVRNTKITTAIVTSWVFRSVKPSKYMATARLPSMADLRLHMFDSPRCANVQLQTVGTGTSRRMDWMTSPDSRPLIWCSGFKMIRWAMASSAMAFTSSGVTKSRPRRAAAAREVFRRA